VPVARELRHIDLELAVARDVAAIDQRLRGRVHEVRDPPDPRPARLLDDIARRAANP